MKPVRLLFLVRRIGPYHDARFEALGRRLPLVVVETRPASTEYPWTTAAGARNYAAVPLSAAAVPETGLRGPDLHREIQRVMQAYRPEAMACSGWADPEYHSAVDWGHRQGIPAMVMSDSTAGDEVRRWWRERMKGSLLRGYAAAVVAGSRSGDYLRRLGFPERGVFTPWDVVDNDYFAVGADSHRTRVDATEVPRRFLCVARFIPKKNLPRLLAAYAGYVAQAGDRPWDLVLSGSGEGEAGLRRQVAALGLAARVQFAGFTQYPDLPATYARAGALVLPSLTDQWGLVVNEAMAAGLPVIVSTGCGCTPELVHPGENGWRFDPADPADLQRCLTEAAGLTPERWRDLGRRSREIVARYSPDAFADAVQQALAATAGGRVAEAPPLARAMVKLMAVRSGFGA